MAVIKLLLVDDESVTRKGLLRGIPWDDFGITEVMEARDGAEGLRLATKWQPDILVTDVRMPKLNGIELAMAVRMILPCVRLIFISGYSDKEYLKAAIRLGAISYVEKPIDLGEITEAIRQAALQIQSAGAQPGQDFLPLVRQDMIYRLIKSGADVEELHRGLELLGTRLGMSSWYMVMIIKLKGGTELLRHYLHRLECAPIDGTYCEKEGLIVVVIQAPTAPGIVDGKNAMLRWMSAQSDEHLAFAALGMPVQGMGQIHASYRQAVVAVQSLFFLGFGKAALYHPNDAVPEADECSEPQFLALLAQEQYEDLSAHVQSMCEALAREPHPAVDHTKRMFLRLFLALEREAERRHIPFSSPDFSSEDQIWRMISGCPTLIELKALLLHRIGEFNEEALGAQSVNRKIVSALRLIEEQYASPDMCVTMIADQVNLTQPYLSALFKKTIGRSISEHVQELRIEKSKQLLIEGDLRLSEIAGKVGYNDTNAYQKAFKRKTGLSPVKFRQKYQR